MSIERWSHKLQIGFPLNFCTVLWTMLPEINFRMNEYFHRNFESGGNLSHKSSCYNSRQLLRYTYKPRTKICGWDCLPIRNFCRPCDRDLRPFSTKMVHSVACAPRKYSFIRSFENLFQATWSIDNKSSTETQFEVYATIPLRAYGPQSQTQILLLLTTVVSCYTVIHTSQRKQQNASQST